MSNTGEQEPTLLSAVRWDERGLVTAIAQDAHTGRVLMVAWMNREALTETARSGQAVYFSRSRQRLWRKGEESGHTQEVRELRLDCDGDVILLQVAQRGGIACHTGREACFFQRWEPATAPGTLGQGEGERPPPPQGRWVAVDPVLQDPTQIYGQKLGE